MKTKLIAVLAIACLGLGGLLAVQWNRAAREKTAVEQLQLQLESATAKSREAGSAVVDLKKENQTLRGRLNISDMELNNARLAYAGVAGMTNAATGKAAKPGDENKGPANPMAAISEMMKDPAMKKAMAQQQRMAMDMIYGKLFKTLQLSKEDTEKFKDLLLDQQMTAMNMGMSMFDNSTNRTEMAQKAAEEQKTKQEAIKNFLGDDKYQQYQDYTSTVGERMMLDQFAKQTDLKPEQSDQLLAVMTEEKKNAQINQPLTQDPNAAFAKLGSPEIIQQQIDQQKAVNENVIERARQILSPEQLTKFQEQLKNQEAMMEMGAKMAQKLLQPGAAQPALPTPTPTTK